MNSPQIVLASTIQGDHASRSGYPLLAEYLEKDAWITSQRQSSKGLFWRGLMWLPRRFAFSRWYLGGSALLEWKCRQYLRRRPKAIVHIFWADFDLGFLDEYLARRGHLMCGTFHHCSDTIGQVIRYPKRLRRFAAIILMSESQRSFMLEAGVAPNRIHVIPHGVDTAYFTPATDDCPKVWTVLTVGGYRRDFGGLRAVCEELQGHDEIRFRIVGPPAFAGMFSDLANVTFESRLSDQQLLSAYRTSACFLMLVENATANNALLEAMSCGLPVVANRIGGISEYVTEACSRLLLSGDAAGISNAILEIYDSPELRSRMSIAARTRAEELDWSHVAEATEGVYRLMSEMPQP